MTRLRDGLLGMLALLLALTCGAPAAHAQRCPYMLNMQAQLMLQQQHNRQAYQPPPMNYYQTGTRSQFQQTPAYQTRTNYTRPTQLYNTRSSTSSYALTLARNTAQARTSNSYLRLNQSHRSSYSLLERHTYSTVSRHTSWSVHTRVGEYGGTRGRSYAYSYLRQHTRTTVQTRHSYVLRSSTRVSHSSRIETVRRSTRQTRPSELTLLRQVSRSRTTALTRPGSRSWQTSAARSRPTSLRTPGPALKKTTPSRPMTLNQTKTTASLKVTGSASCSSCHHSVQHGLQTTPRYPSTLLVQTPGARLPLYTRPALVQTPPPYPLGGTRLPLLTPVDLPRLPSSLPTDLTPAPLAVALKAPPPRPRPRATEKTVPTPRSSEPAELKTEEPYTSRVAEMLRVPDLPGAPRSVNALLVEAGRQPEAAAAPARLKPEVVLAAPPLPDGAPVLPPAEEQERPSVVVPLVEVVLAPPPLGALAD
jgi:hypothetical protein